MPGSVRVEPTVKVELAVGRRRPQVRPAAAEIETGDLLRNEQYYRTWIEKGLHRSRPSDAWNHFLSTPVDAIAARFGLEGPRGCVVAACSSSTIAIARGVEAIRAGRADVVLAGGADALARLTFSGFNQLRLMDPER